MAGSCYLKFILYFLSLKVSFMYICRIYRILETVCRLEKVVKSKVWKEMFSQDQLSAQRAPNFQASRSSTHQVIFRYEKLFIAWLGISFSKVYRVIQEILILIDNTSIEFHCMVCFIYQIRFILCLIESRHLNETALH